ncbi:MAG TPA: helicase-related protein [Candidatus Absconditabacterales bacterium]|nr:helicase-related protein [Candidatus Absconditabacterales bacterium]HMT26738.1 helicase-related protein [Candidatus Absconditabacterales bacterium]
MFAFPLFYKITFEELEQWREKNRVMVFLGSIDSMFRYPNIADFLQVKEAQIAKAYPAFLDHLFGKIDEHISKNGKILILTLTKKSAEEVSHFFVSKGYKTFYLHSEISTIDRWEIIKKLRTGEIDILVGINLLREGIDMPEVSLIAILDADKEGFLRSTTSLVQIIGRAARNPDSEVILYADHLTESMTKALRETYRRRNIQIAHNKKHGINPSIAISNVKGLEVVKTDDVLDQNFDLLSRGKVKRLKRLTKKEKSMIEADLKAQLDEAIKNWEFEKAAVLRDQLKQLNDDVFTE